MPATLSQGHGRMGTTHHMDERSVTEVLEQWLRESSFDAPLRDVRPYVTFPSDEAFALYLGDVEDRPDQEVIGLLWRMLSACTSTMDTDIYRLMLNHASQVDQEDAEAALNSGSMKRLRWREKTNQGDAWEGVTWVLEMLPAKPGSAIRALDLYMLAQHGLPDRRIHTISDAIDIIRAKWIGNPKTIPERVALLKELDPRKFEALVAALWREMGYETVLTPSSQDGGYDVHATRDLVGRNERVIVECKRYREKKVPVAIVRALNGLGNPELAHAKLAIVTTSGFTKGAKKEAEDNRRTELIDGTTLVPMLNEHLGADWPKRLEHIVRHAFQESSLSTEEQAPS